MMSSTSPSLQIKSLEQRAPWLYLIVIALALCIVISFGLAGVQHPFYDLSFDLNNARISGDALHRGIDPYSLVTFFAYPPHFLSLAYLTLYTSPMFIFFLNFCFLLLICYVVSQAIHPHSKLTFALVMLITVFNPFAVNVMFMGQTSLLVCGLLFLSWHWHSNESSLYQIGAGVILAIASIKPNLVLLVTLWFLFERRWILLISAFLTFVALALYPSIMFGPITIFTSWIKAIQTYQLTGLDNAGAPHVIGIASILSDLGLGLHNLTWIGIIVTVLLFIYRKRLAPDCILSLLMLLTALFVYAHDYDLIILASAIIPFWLYLPQSNPQRLCLFILWAIIIFPHRFVASLNIPPLLHWRSYFLVILFAWILALAIKAAAPKKLVKL